MNEIFMTMFGLIFYALIIIGVVQFSKFIKQHLRNTNKTSDGKALVPRIMPTVKYNYRRKAYMMTKPENDFYDVIMSALGDEYLIFPQIHLSAILDHRMAQPARQRWIDAFRYINQKSVDYVVCDKIHRTTLLVIELDDTTHDSEKRTLRDVNVDCMLKLAGIPLLRVNRNNMPSDYDVAQQIRSLMSIREV